VRGAERVSRPLGVRVRGCDTQVRSDDRSRGADPVEGAVRVLPAALRGVPSPDVQVERDDEPLRALPAEPPLPSQLGRRAT